MNWTNFFENNVLDLAVFLIAGIWYLAKERKDNLTTRRKVEKLESRLDNREKILPDTLESEVVAIKAQVDTHERSAAPHPSCPVHNTQIESLRSTMKDGFDRLEKAIANTDQRLYDLMRNGKRKEGL